MAFHDRLLEMICCPVARVPLRPATAAELADLNAEIGRGGVAYASGEPVGSALDGALAASDGSAVYGIREGVPDLEASRRLLRGGRAAQARPAARPAPAYGPWDARWDALSTQWDLVGPPLRPFPEDIDLLQRLVASGAAGDGRPDTRALLLGVTPEIAAMRWPADTHLLALDLSAGMIRNLWPTHLTARAAAARGDWTRMPVRDGACDVVVGDGFFTTLQQPHHFTALVDEIRRVLKDGGALATRLFARPEERESLATIFSDFRAGRTRNPHILPWRIAMAVHGDLTTGARLGDVWEAWCEHVPEPESLMAALGWPPDTMGFLEVYRGADARVMLPTLGEVRELFARDFVETACHFPGYEAGGCYPTVVFKPKPR